MIVVAFTFRLKHDRLVSELILLLLWMVQSKYIRSIVRSDIFFFYIFIYLEMSYGLTLLVGWVVSR